MMLAACAAGTNDGDNAGAPDDVEAKGDAAAVELVDAHVSEAASPRDAASTADAQTTAVGSGKSTDAAASLGTSSSTSSTSSSVSSVSSSVATGSTPPPANGDAAVAAASGPTIGGCAIFPPDNPWNTRVDDPVKFPVHPNSATYIANMNPGTHLHPDWGSWSTDKYGIPWQTVPGSQPFVPMTFDYSDESDPGPYPFPPNALVEGGAGSGGDMHVLVIDTGTCTLYETWDSTYVDPGWSCGSGAKFNLGSNALRPDGWTSADAAGLPVLPGLVRVAEVQAGVIQHALRFTVQNTQNAYIHPATHAAGKSNANLPPMGLRIRLKASFDMSAITGPARVILTAMQQYGMLLADNGSAWYVTGDSDDAWTPLMDAVNQAFGSVHGSDFEAVETGPIVQ
jgi:hypothetical protein